MMPEIGQTITVELPDERTRAQVQKILAGGGIIAQLSQYTTQSKSHSYKQGDFVACHLVRGLGGVQSWKALDEKVTAQDAAPDPVEGAGETRENVILDCIKALGAEDVLKGERKGMERAIGVLNAMLPRESADAVDGCIL